MINNILSAKNTVTLDYIFAVTFQNKLSRSVLRQIGKLAVWLSYFMFYLWKNNSKDTSS